MHSEIKKNAVKGAFWSLLEKIGIQLSQLIIGIILARILTPEDFGLIGMITVFFAVGMVIVEGGFRQAYVHKKEVSDIDASTVFYTNLSVSILFYLILFFFAPFISKFYNQEILIPLIRIMGIFIIIKSLGVVQEAKLARSLDFKTRSIIYIIAVVLSGIAGILAAIFDLGVYSLVIQQLLSATIVVCCLWIFTEKITLRYFSRKSFNSMVSFGSWILFQSILSQFFNNFYQIIIGKYYSAIQVGYYTNARRFQKSSSENITTALGTVAFPVFSKFQDDKEAIRNAAAKYLENLLFIIFPIMIILFVVAKAFVIVLLTEKWLPMVPYLKLLCIVGILYPINVVSAQVFWGIGKSKINFFLAVLTFTLRLVNVIFMNKFGVWYIILGEIILGVIIFILRGIFMNKFVQFGLREQLKIISKYLVFGVIMILIGFLVLFSFNDNVIMLIINVILLGTSYLILCLIFNKKQTKEAYYNIIHLKNN